MEQLKIGAQCERLWRGEIEANRAAAIDEATRVTREQVSKAHAVPVHERKGWIESDDGQEYLDDVRGAMQEDQGIDLVGDNRDPARVLTIKPRRPKGKRTDIIAQVAHETGLSRRMVETCWKKFRRIENTIF